VLVNWRVAIIFRGMKGLLTFAIFLPVLFCVQKGSGQDSTSRFSVVLSPAIFIPVSVAVQGGVQYRLNKRLSIMAEAAFPTFYPKNTEYEKIEYWRTGIEIKYRTGKIHSSTKYISLQNNYLFRQLIDKDQSLYYSKTQTFSYKNAVINSPVLASAFKVGIELPAGKKTFVDVFIGAGLRFVFTKYKTESALLTSTEPSKATFLDFDDAWLYNYTLTRLHVTAGLRFGLRL
jgi:hypothetical protein